MSLLGLALLSPPPPNRCLYVITCPASSQRLLKELLSATLTGLYYEVTTDFLHKSKFQQSDIELLLPRRLVVCDASQLGYKLAKPLFNFYFNTSCGQHMVAGKHYFFNTSLVIISDWFPVLTDEVAADYNNIYHVNLTSQCPDEEEVDLTALTEPFFVMLTSAANQWYDKLQTSSLDLPTLPEPLNKQQFNLIKTAIPKDKTKKQVNKKRAAEAKQIFLDFLTSRVDVGMGYEQNAVEFRNNFAVYLQDTGQINTTSYDSRIIGRYLSRVINQDYGYNFEVKRRSAGLGKTDTIYPFVNSRSYN